MKTITYNSETHVLVPREPSEEMAGAGWDDAVEHEADNIDIYDIAAIYRTMIAAAPQPDPVDSEPVAYKIDDLKAEQPSNPELRAGIALQLKEIERLRFALENCRLFAARNRKESWALLILGFLAEAGVVGSVTRDFPNADH